MSKYDIKLYEAVRELSILKEAAGVEKRVLLDAEKKVNILQNQEHEFSEMAKVRNMQWWSVEYGLVGGLETAKIYGAGLLSSIGESEWCMSDSVKKLPYTIDVVNMGFDITKPQPQLYVTPSFAHLMEVLEDFADTLSVRKGGVGGINKLIESQSVGTIELNTGLQISGVFSDVLVGDNNEVVFFKTSGPTALSYREKELVGHGIKYHKDGYSSPLGLLKSVSLPLENMTPIDLKIYNIIDGQRLFFEFESGITVEGLNITGIRDVKGKIQIIKLEDCTVKYGDKILFKPEYGVYDMAIGSSIVSAFSGAADPESFENLYSVSKVKTISYKMSEKELQLNEIAEQIRLVRQDTFDLGLLKNLFFKLKTEHPENWLLPLEILELTNNEKIGSKIEEYLIKLSNENKSIESLVQSGIAMVKSSF
jgi:phenylalanine-4-hydroxylase